MSDVCRSLLGYQGKCRIRHVCLEPNTPLVVENALEPIGR
jgi:hypothetical protein